MDSLLWVDLNDPSADELRHVEKTLGIKFPDEEAAEEIELSSRYIELEDSVIINSNFLVEKDDFYTNYIVSFILKNDILISNRNGDIRSFADTVRKFKVNTHSFASGLDFLLSLFEARIDLDADLLENLSVEISDLIKGINPEEQVEARQLYRITHLQETTMVLRENIIDNHRVISNMLRSDRYPTYAHTKLRSLIKDTQSLTDHTAFNFGRLEYLQNTVLGLINLEQNKIIKIFTEVSLIFMPPTLIASVYGMNFRILPELQWENGYYFAIGLMVVSSLVTLWIFRRKQWL
jgi:magnesium transporter